jgi:hypothetical protein
MQQALEGRSRQCATIDGLANDNCRHSNRFVLAYVTFLPLALWNHLSWATIVVAPVITFLLAGIENIGVMIENPMRILPMAAYCTTIHSNILCVAAAWASEEYVRPDAPFHAPTFSCLNHASVDCHPFFNAPSWSAC